VSKALKKAGLTIDQIDLIEIQEAFAVQTLADAKLMGLKSEDLERKVNVNGSGISLGHPIGATGVMRLVTLVHEMVRRQKIQKGLILMGIGALQKAVFRNLKIFPGLQYRAHARLPRFDRWRRSRPKVCKPFLAA
jgi:acetyl-CoA acetyltransferase